jgi:hypothetical protein
MVLGATKPFHDTSDTSGILVVRLTSRVFSLETGTGLDGTSVLDLDYFTTDEQFPTIGINGHQRIGLIEVNADGQDPLWLWNIQGHGDTSEQRALALNDRETINFDSMVKDGFEVVRNGVVKVLATTNRPDGQGTICSKISITPTLANEKEGACFSEEEGAFRWLLMRPGSGVSSSHQANSRDGHLRMQRTFDAMIAGPLQILGVQWFTAIVARRRQRLLDVLKPLEGLLQVLIMRNQNGDRSLYVHGLI